MAFIARLLAFLLTFLAFVGAVRKGRSLARRWTDAQLTLILAFRPNALGTNDGRS